MKALELKIPPLLLMLLFAAAIWFSQPLWPQVIQPSITTLITSLILLFTGIATAILGVYAFRQAQTTVDPTKPDTSSNLVKSGIYRRTRNPMYLGFSLSLCALAVYLASPFALLLVLLFCSYLTRFQIMPEEQVLLKIFGQDYQDYCHQVRRWL